MDIRKSAEDYLEMILMLQEEKGCVRSIDIAAGLGVSKPSVSVAMKRLREDGYIDMEPGSSISLTPRGMEVAQRIYSRHRVITKLLMQLGVSEETAREDACKIEHDVSQETFEAMQRHFERYGH